MKVVDSIIIIIIIIIILLHCFYSARSTFDPNYFTSDWRLFQTWLKSFSQYLHDWSDQSGSIRIYLSELN